MKRIILSGGGTLGSVSPLIAIYEEIKDILPQTDFLWIGTKNGPEKNIAENYGIPYVPIASGKLRRYFSIQNFFDIFFIIAGFFQSIFIIMRYKPSIVLTAGGFVAVPMSWASRCFRVPVCVHQQDSKVGLANKLMAPFAKLITLTFENHKKYFANKNVVVTGNPLRKDIVFSDTKKAIEFFGFSDNLPIILILGGGTGAKAINDLVFKSIGQLAEFCQIIHSTGEGKSGNAIENPRYRVYTFLSRDELSCAYSASDLVVSRAGMSTLSELAFLKKPSIIIPMPKSHQEDNAHEFEKKNAARVLDQKELTPERFVKTLYEILQDKKLLQTLSDNIGRMFPPDAAERVVEEVMKLMD